MRATGSVGRLLGLVLCAAGAPLGCDGGEPDRPLLAATSWVAEPVAEWPDFVLSNEVEFADTTYAYLANAFAVDTGADTVGVTCKHIFMVFRNLRGVRAIALGDDFRSWTLRSSRDSSRALRTRRLVNADPNEPIGDFASLKDRDWLVFELGEWSPGVHPLTIRFTPLRPGEVVYAVGRSQAGRHDPDPVRSPLRVFRASGTYYYVQPLDGSVDPTHTSGSPVIDEKGYLVGMVSGAVGRLSVVAGVRYLQEQLDRHGIAYAPQWSE